MTCLCLHCRFDAGVTTIQSSPHLEHTLAVGRLESLSHALTVFTLCWQLWQHGALIWYAPTSSDRHASQYRRRCMAGQMASWGITKASFTRRVHARWLQSVGFWTSNGCTSRKLARVYPVRPAWVTGIWSWLVIRPCKQRWYFGRQLFILWSYTASLESLDIYSV